MTDNASQSGGNPNKLSNTAKLAAIILFITLGLSLVTFCATRIGGAGLGELGWVLIGLVLAIPWGLFLLIHFCQLRQAASGNNKLRAISLVGIVISSCYLLISIIDGYGGIDIFHRFLSQLPILAMGIIFILLATTFKNNKAIYSIALVAGIIMIVEYVVCYMFMGSESFFYGFFYGDETVFKYFVSHCILSSTPLLTLLFTALYFNKFATITKAQQ